jgi:hypothetical protein
MNSANRALDQRPIIGSKDILGAPPFLCELEGEVLEEIFYQTSQPAVSHLFVDPIVGSKPEKYPRKPCEFNKKQL